MDSNKEMDGVNALLNLASIATSVMTDISKGDNSSASTITTTTATTADKKGR